MTLSCSSYNCGRMDDRQVDRDVAWGGFDFSTTYTGRLSLIGVLRTPLLKRELSSTKLV